MNVRKVSILLIGIGLIISLVLPVIYHSNTYLVDMLISIMIWSAVAQSWILMAGIGGMWSLGHTAFFGIGAYVTAYFAGWGIPTILGFPAGVLCSALVAFILGYFVCRLSGHYFSLVTFVFTIGMGVLFRYFDKYTGGDYGLSVPLKITPSGLVNLSWESQLPYYYISVIIVIICTAIIWAIVRSSFGYQLSAIREDIRASRAVGINVFRIRLVTFCISSGLASLAGTLYVSYYKLIEPTTAFGFNTALHPIIFSIAGGVANLFGGIVGSSILVPLASYLNKFAAQLPGVDRVAYGFILMLLILLLPKGILGLIRKQKFHIQDEKATAEKAEFQQSNFGA
jgi:branched-chain amino acid transport system permease protein